jgi:hypothetical protein
MERIASKEICKTYATIARACEVSLLFVAGLAAELACLIGLLILTKEALWVFFSQDSASVRLDELFLIVGYFGTIVMIILDALLNLESRGVATIILPSSRYAYAFASCRSIYVPTMLVAIVWFFLRFMLSASMVTVL